MFLKNDLKMKSTLSSSWFHQKNFHLKWTVIQCYIDHPNGLNSRTINSNRPALSKRIITQTTP